MTQRLADAVVVGQNAYARGRKIAPVNPMYGGMNGYAPTSMEWVSTANYVRKNLVVLLMDAPTYFQQMPDPTFMVQALKSLIETHASKWEGFNMGLTVDWSETAIGGGGEKWHDLTNVTRAQTTPKCSVTDKYGRPFQNMLNDWIRYLMMDPDTKVPMISTIAGYRPDDQLPDTFTCTLLAYELDPNHIRVAKSWVVVNVMPKGTGDIEGVRDLTAPGELKNLDLEWSGWAVSGLGIDAMTQSIVDGMTLANANPFLRNAHIQTIDAFVADSDAGGYKGTMEDLGADVVMPSAG